MTTRTQLGPGNVDAHPEAAGRDEARALVRAELLEQRRPRALALHEDRVVAALAQRAR